MTKLLVMVADDDSAVAVSTTKLLRTTYEVAPPVMEFDQLDARLAEYAPVVLLLDLMWGSASVLPCLAKLVAAHSAINICMYSAHGAPSLVAKALHCGAKGYVSKPADASEILAAVECISKGEQYLSIDLRGLSGLVEAAAKGRRPVVHLLQHGDVGSPAYAVAVPWLMFDLGLSHRQAEVALGKLCTARLLVG